MPRFSANREQKPLADGSKKRCRAGQLRISEIMTILKYFHQSHYRNFKAYYTEHVCQQLKAEYSMLVSDEVYVNGVTRALNIMNSVIN